MERRSFFKVKIESFKLTRSVFSSLEISMVLIELFVVLSNGIFTLNYGSKWEW